MCSIAVYWKEASEQTRALIWFISEDMHFVEKIILYKPALIEEIYIVAIHGKIRNKYAV